MRIVSQVWAHSVSVFFVLLEVMWISSFIGRRYADCKCWEQNRREPDPAARALLTVIASNPEVVEDALKAG
jgi:Predicted transcriptional regulator